MDFTFGRDGAVCSNCGNKWPLEFFDSQGSTPKHLGVRSICAACRTHKRHAYKHANPFRGWASRSLSKHARDDGYPSLKVFIQATGLTPGDLADEAWHLFQSDGKCRHCRRTFKWLAERTGNPRGTMQLDRHDASKPLTRSNYRFLCETGNKQKGAMPPEIYDIRQRCWEIYDEHQVWENRNEQLALAI